MGVRLEPRLRLPSLNSDGETVGMEPIVDLEDAFSQTDLYGNFAGERRLFLTVLLAEWRTHKNAVLSIWAC